MNNSEKINKKLELILERVLNFNQSLLNLCESEIEKLFLVNLLYYMFKNRYTLRHGFEWEDARKENSLHNLNFFDFYPIYEGVNEVSPELKLSGFSFIDHVRIKSNEYKNVYKIYPQHSTKIENSNFRFDFGILCELFRDGFSKGQIKIAVECDGFEFHSKKEDLTRDNLKNRILIRNGWKPYRFSGSEIYHIQGDQQIDNLFYEIRVLCEGIF